jgi:dTMP kinase
MAVLTDTAASPPPPPGRFISFEGGEGSGKSTQARLLAERLKHAGIDVVLTREPGGSLFAEQVREFILSGRQAPHPPLAEALLFYAARADHLAATIRPALAAGRWVIADRFSDSTRVYQGAAGGVSAADIDAIDRIVVAATIPALTLILDLPPEEGLRRAAERRPPGARADPFEARDLGFHQRLRDGFQAVASSEPHRCVLIDATGPAAPIAAAVWRTIETRLLNRPLS